MIELYNGQLNPQKNMVSFTWDDNFSNHYRILAPIFLDFGVRCTFFINPGEEDFCEKYYKGYKRIHDLGFEIGSHGLFHCHFSALDYKGLMFQFVESKRIITNMFFSQPTTFAFPHHDFNDNMLSVARSIYFETRNTLEKSLRFSLKSNTEISDVKKAIQKAKNEKLDIVFSGHAVQGDIWTDSEQGYEPIHLKLLFELLKMLQNDIDIQICTFEQMCLKNFLTSQGAFLGNKIIINDKSEIMLNEYGFNNEKIRSII